MFSTGDCKYWIIVEKVELIGEDGNSYYENQHKTMVRTYDSTKPVSVQWYRRGGYVEDPWVSRNHHNARPNLMLYGGAAYTHHNQLLASKGADVYIRKSKILVFG